MAALCIFMEPQSAFDMWRLDLRPRPDSWAVANPADRQKAGTDAENYKSRAEQERMQRGTVCSSRWVRVHMVYAKRVLSP